MELDMILSAIGSMGFPIIACIFMWQHIGNTMKEFTVTMTKNTELLEQLLDELKRGK